MPNHRQEFVTVCAISLLSNKFQSLGIQSGKSLTLQREALYLQGSGVAAPGVVHGQRQGQIYTFSARRPGREIEKISMTM